MFLLKQINWTQWIKYKDLVSKLMKSIRIRMVFAAYILGPGCTVDSGEDLWVEDGWICEVWLVLTGVYILGPGCTVDSGEDLWVEDGWICEVWLVLTADPVVLVATVGCDEDVVGEGDSDWEAPVTVVEAGAWFWAGNDDAKTWVGVEVEADTDIEAFEAGGVDDE
jgi:hypothetical protein